MQNSFYKFGMKNDYIKTIQKRLGIKPTGYFGETTFKNVVQFQKENGLEADGIVGQLTLNKLFPIRNYALIYESTIKLDFLKGELALPLLAEIETKFTQYEIELAHLNIAYFLAQCGEESGNFTQFEENLHYSAKGLQSIFPQYFHSVDKAKQYAGKAIEIGNLVYANKLGNGDVASGDGYFYRGRGSISLTGKANYLAFNKWLNEKLNLSVNLITNPGLVATDYKLDAGFYYFTENNLWTICQKGSTKWISDELTKRVVGVAVSNEEKQQRFDRFCRYYHLCHANMSV